VHTTAYFGNAEEYFEKGCYPYDYMTDETTFDEPALPPKEAFFNKLTNEHLSDDQYERAKNIWTMRDMKSLRDWHEFYLTFDVLLLADVFEAFRQTMVQAQGLDCLHFPTLPSLTLQLALKITGVELELITDPSIYVMIEAGIRGGLSYVSQRHAKANFPAMADYDPDLPTSHMLYLDCNSLYTTCQSYPLPVGGFRMLSDDEVAVFDVATVSDDSPVG